MIVSKIKQMRTATGDRQSDTGLRPSFIFYRIAAPSSGENAHK